MKTATSVLLILLAFAFGAFGCASIPLSSSEIQEQQESIEKHSDLMDFYNEGLGDVGRTAIAVKVIPSGSSDVLQRQLVKSRESFSVWERFKRKVLRRKITRDELKICNEIF